MMLPAVQTNDGHLTLCAKYPARLRASATDADEAPLMLVTASMGGVGQLRTRDKVPSHPGRAFHGSGVGRSRDEAFIPALAEVIERHATGTFYEDQFVCMAASSLDARALDLDTIAHCSEKERASPHCPLTLPTKSEPIRWVTGLSLQDGKPILVPAIMVYSHAGWRGPQERFWLPISTGCAAHSTYEKAVLSGLCEVVERDAISLVWLQQLDLPRIVIDDPDPHTMPYLQLPLQGNADIAYHFFNATTDVGLPTVYALQVSKHHPFARTIVACATALTFEEASVKVVKDFAALSRAFVHERKVPSETESFTGLFDGAAYMARPEHAHAFDFLLQSSRQVSLRDLCREEQPLKTLHAVLQHLAVLKMQAIAVDLTTDEAIRAGLRVVRVLIPELQPFSLQTAAQYLAHPRLYSAPIRIGYRAKDELHLNQWPQPFA